MNTIMSDYIHELRFLDEYKLTLELSYRLNFEDKACGSIRIFQGEIDPEADNYELYMELLECGLSRDEVYNRLEKFIGEIKDGKIDLSL